MKVVLKPEHESFVEVWTWAYRACETFQQIIFHPNMHAKYQIW